MTTEQGSNKIVGVPFEQFQSSIGVSTPQSIDVSTMATTATVATQTGRKTKSSPQQNQMKMFEKFSRILKIVLKLAKVDRYNENGLVRDDNGNFVAQSDMVRLLNKSMSHEKLLIGKQEYIKRLHEAKVDPEIIVNDDIRGQLLRLYRDKPVTYSSVEVQTEPLPTQRGEEPAGAKEETPRDRMETEEPVRVVQRLPKKRKAARAEEEAALTSETGGSGDVVKEPERKIARVRKAPQRWTYVKE